MESIARESRFQVSLKWLILATIALSTIASLLLFKSRFFYPFLGLAIICACWTSARIEEAWFEKMRSRSATSRVLIGIATVMVGILVIVCSIVLLLVVGKLGSRGAMISLGLIPCLMAIWLFIAAVASLFVLIVETVFSSLFPSLRSQLTMIVLLLLAVLASCGALAYHSGIEFVDLAREASPSTITNDGPRDLSPQQQHDFEEGIGRIAGYFYSGISLLVLVAAAISAAQKIAGSVMYRLNPLSSAFEDVGLGNLDVSVPEKGAREFVHLSHRFNVMVRDLAMAKHLESAFGVYVSDHVLERIRQQHGENWLSASGREATVLFADIRGFTSISEVLSPSDTLDILNLYFAKVVPVIDQSNGYIDKFIGDAVVVVFNGPIDQEDHALLGLRCAYLMQEAITELNCSGDLTKIDQLGVGIGIATGHLVAGNIGHHTQMEYTVIGDTVNLAARLSGLAPAGEVWVNEANANAVTGEFNLSPLPPIEIKGKSDSVNLFSLP